jgi:hypothetical protein
MSETTIDHLYRIGELVTLDSRAGYSVKAATNFTVIARLPPVGTDFQYRIKSVSEPYERVVLEHQLAPASQSDRGAKSFFKEPERQTT